MFKLKINAGDEIPIPQRYVFCGKGLKFSVIRSVIWEYAILSNNYSSLLHDLYLILQEKKKKKLHP